MKAAVYYGYNQPLKIEDIEIDDPAPREVVVRVAATGVCHSDLHYLDRPSATLPGLAVLGHEAAGIVEKTGRDVGYVKPGDHVIACYSAFCGACRQCLSGHPNRCTNRGSFVRSSDDKPRLSLKGRPLIQFADLGTYAEKILVHENALAKIDNDYPLDRAALIGCAVTTGVGAALNTAKIEPGSAVAVIGAGGVGLSVIQGALLAGARQIIAVDTIENKLAMARRFGATHTVDASSADPVPEIQSLSDGGVNYSFEAIGGKKTAEQAFDCLAPGGVATLIGVIPDDEKVEIYGTMLLAERRLQGCLMGSNRFRIDMLNYIEFDRQGRLKLADMISRRGGLADLNEAFRAMKAGEVARTVLTLV